MKIDVLLIGSKGLRYEAEVITSFTVGDELFAANIGHNKLMHNLVLTHWETGFPVKVCKLNPTVEVDPKLVMKYVAQHKEELSNFIPGDRQKINDLPLFD